MSKKMIIPALIFLTLLIAGCVNNGAQNIEEEYCVSEESGERMSLTEARQMALESECGDRLKDDYMCNENTGTWWLDLDIQQEGCNPACVVNVATGQAEINWRCTGVIP